MDQTKLVAKCGGILKIVSAISKVPCDYLKYMNDDFMGILECLNNFDSLLPWTHSCFDACTDSEKPCILYLSVFPASSKIRQHRLLRRWIAEGYSRDTAGYTAMENAQNTLLDLMRLSIIQKGKHRGICQVNGFFREYITRPTEDNLVFALDGHRSPKMPRTGLHLTIMAVWHRDQAVFESIDFARLRSLTVFGTWRSFFISDTMKRLRVLDLEGMISIRDDDIKDIFVKLLSLKFISLRGCRNISRLPDTLGGLRQLQTLDVRFTSIVVLPSAIIKLQKLQYIGAGTIVLPDQDWTSASSEVADGATGQPPSATLTELEGSDSSMTSPENVIAESPAHEEALLELDDHGSSISEGRPTVPTSSENVIAESPAQAATSKEAQHRPMLPKVLLKIRRVATWSLRGSEREKEDQHHNGGVEVPVRIGNLKALHTVGVVNVNASGGEAFLKQLAGLTQLLKLRVCGINWRNWRMLCSALLDKDCHLESLSVRFDVDCLDDSFMPPKTLKSLKLYGPITTLPFTIKHLVNLKKMDLEMIITRPDDMHLFFKDALPSNDVLNRLCIRVEGDQELDFSSPESYYGNSWYNPSKLWVVKIVCSSRLEVTFGYGIVQYAEVLIIQCSEGSSFGVAGSYGLNNIQCLKTVWLKGSYSEELRQHLQELVDCHDKKPLLKLEPLQ